MACSHQRFSDLSRGSRAAIIIGAVVQFTMQAAALRDLAHRSAAQVHGTRTLWAALSFVNFAGPAAYFLVGRKPHR